jgi:hypothetical protein
VFNQSTCGLRKRTDEFIYSSFPRFPHVLCFSEHHRKQLELEQINLEGYKLGPAYCRGGVMEACALKLELTALNIHVVTLQGNF